MSTTIDTRRGAAPRRAAAPGPTSGLANQASPDEMRRRGTTVISEKVFEKIAGQAASEVSTSRGRSGGVLGIGSQSDSDALPKANVELSADSVDVDLAIGIAYPGSIRAAVQDVRNRVTSRVHELTGVPVHRVDIDVTFLTTTASPADAGSSGGHRHRKEKLR